MNHVQAENFIVAIPLVLLLFGLALYISKYLNVLMLGNQIAKSLGLDTRRWLIFSLILVAALMAISTSLVGPLSFFGFLAAHFTYYLTPTYDHRHLFLMGPVVGVFILSLAYFTMNHLFNAQGVVGILIEFIGGITFLILIFKDSKGGASMIELVGVTKSYGDQLCLGPLTLKVPSEKFSAILGPNGAGKSTLLLMMGRLLESDQGQVILDGRSIDSLSKNDLARQVSILRQENHLTVRVTVKQLVSFGRFPYTRGRINQEDDRIIQRYLNFLDLEDLSQRYLDQLSGGQRQKAYVAMVLAQETPYILLDEPLNNLDMAASIQMMHYLNQIVTELGRTVVAVLHDVNLASRYCDWLFTLKQGQLIQEGSPYQVVTSANLEEIYGTQIEIIQGDRGPVAIY